MQDFLSRLNPEQLKAVTLPRQSALILAGAGSGKTRVLTTRIAYLIQTGEASPGGDPRRHLHQQGGARDAHAALRDAAHQHARDVGRHLPRPLQPAAAHALPRRGLPQLFQILDSGDQQSLIKRLAKAQGLDEEKFPPRQLQNFINNCKEAGLRANAVEAGDEFTRRMVAFYADYDAQCNREGVVDFAELLLRTFECCRAT
jgi:DNA helicase-2/ATP-dependent DNA helicase PcrA